MARPAFHPTRGPPRSAPPRPRRRRSRRRHPVRCPHRPGHGRRPRSASPRTAATPSKLRLRQHRGRPRRGPAPAVEPRRDPAAQVIETTEQRSGRARAARAPPSADHRRVHLLRRPLDAPSSSTARRARADDYGDKAYGKAYTNAVKTFVRTAWLLPTGDAHEAESPERVAAGARPAPLGSARPRPTQGRDRRYLVPLVGRDRAREILTTIESGRSAPSRYRRSRRSSSSSTRWSTSTTRRGSRASTGSSASATPPRSRPNANAGRGRQGRRRAGRRGRRGARRRRRASEVRRRGSLAGRPGTHRHRRGRRRRRSVTRRRGRLSEGVPRDPARHRMHASTPRSAS